MSREAREVFEASASKKVADPYERKEMNLYDSIVMIEERDKSGS